MSFIVAGSMLLVALLAGIVLEGIGVGRRQKAQRGVPLFDAW
jgi:hypothetical protein